MTNHEKLKEEKKKKRKSDINPQCSVFKGWGVNRIIEYWINLLSVKKFLPWNLYTEASRLFFHGVCGKGYKSVK